jgi:hypothetical protein
MSWNSCTEMLCPETRPKASCAQGSGGEFSSNLRNNSPVSFSDCTLRRAGVPGTQVRKKGARLRQGDIQGPGGEFEFLIRLLNNSLVSFCNCVFCLAVVDKGMPRARVENSRSTYLIILQSVFPTARSVVPGYLVMFGDMFASCFLKSYQRNQQHALRHAIVCTCIESAELHRNMQTPISLRCSWSRIQRRHDSVNRG